MKKTNIYILCGGKGKRMKKYTKKIPKPLVKVGQKAISGETLLAKKK